MPIWRDLADDFRAGSAYSSIPLDLIFSCNNRRELIERRYGLGLKRNNKETIGTGIFLARAKRLVKEAEWQKLYGWNCVPCFIGRAKNDIVYPLSEFLYNSLIDASGGLAKTIDQTFIKDALKMSINLHRAIPLTFRSVRAVKEWHDDLAITTRAKGLPVVKIPQNSRFKNLRLPNNCIRLTTRKQLVEESKKQNNCVSSYVRSINDDECSIWSMRKKDGSRNTIEIGVRTSKKNPNGYFFIRQMRGFNNTSVADEDHNFIKNAIDKCVVA